MVAPSDGWGSVVSVWRRAGWVLWRRWLLEAVLRFGGVAQLGEHLLCKQGVVGSIPIVSTKFSCCRVWGCHALSRWRSWPSYRGISEIGEVMGLARSAPGALSAVFVLCQGESGSGASLGACDRSRSVVAKPW